MYLRTIFYFGLGAALAGVGTVIVTKDVMHFWLTGCGATFIALALIVDKLHHDWTLSFGELTRKINGSADAVRACYADIDRLKDEMKTLKPDNIDQLEMRIENLEAAEAFRTGFGEKSRETYKPPAKTRTTLS